MERQISNVYVSLSEWYFFTFFPFFLHSIFQRMPLLKSENKNKQDVNLLH